MDVYFLNIILVMGMAWIEFLGIFVILWLYIYRLHWLDLEKEEI